MSNGLVKGLEKKDIDDEQRPSKLQVFSDRSKY